MMSDTSNPQFRHGTMTWDGRELADDNQWMQELNAEELRLIANAVASTKASGKPIELLTRDDYAFGAFGDRLLQWQDDLMNGHGFVVLRGLAELGADDKDLVRAYWGMGLWLGQAVSQNASAHLLGHVIDKRAPASADTRIYQTSKAQPFHSDSCDIVGLLCLRQARHGGASAIASSAAIHNAMLEHDAAALRTLYGSFHCDRYGEIPEGAQPWYQISIFSDVDNKLVCVGMDPDIRSAQRLDGVESLSEAQQYALDSFQQTANTLALNMELQRGDVQLLNNLAVVHARTAYEDFDDPALRRYMVRLWLSSPQGRRLPEFLAARWGSIEPGSVRGGITVKGATPSVHLDPGT